MCIGVEAKFINEFYAFSNKLKNNYNWSILISKLKKKKKKSLFSLLATFENDCHDDFESMFLIQSMI